MGEGDRVTRILWIFLNLHKKFLIIFRLKMQIVWNIRSAEIDIITKSMSNF